MMETRLTKRHQINSDYYDLHYSFVSFLVTAAKTILVSAKGENTDACGTIESHCLTLTFALLRRSSNNDTILIDGKNGSKRAEYLEDLSDPILIQYGLNLNGYNGTPVIHFTGTQPIFKINGNNQPHVRVNIRDITFESRGPYSTMFYVRDASFQCYRCSFHDMSTAIEFVLESSSDLVVQKSAFVGVQYGIKVYHKCALGRISIHDTTFSGVPGGSITGLQLEGDCIFPYPNANIYLRIERTNMTNFLAGVDMSISYVNLFDIVIEKCIFSHQTRGAVIISVGPTHGKLTKIYLQNSHFYNNRADSGGALQVISSQRDATNVQVNVTQCRFETNEATSMGGAVALKGGMTSRVKDCSFVANDCHNKDIMQFDYGKGAGGALGMDAMGKTMNTLIEGCLLANNSAGAYGGMIYAKAGKMKSQLVIVNSTLEGWTTSASREVTEGALIYSEIYTNLSRVTGLIRNPKVGGDAVHLTGIHGSVIDTSSIFTVAVGFSFKIFAVPIDSYAVSGRHAFETTKVRSAEQRSGVRKWETRISGTKLEKAYWNESSRQKKELGTTAKKSYRPVKTRNGSMSHVTSVLYHTFSLHYFPCLYSHYSLNESKFTGLSLYNPECIRCPYGGNCQNGQLRAKESFWGYKDGNNIKFVPLIEGYGCSGGECVNYDSCAKDRTGPLCARCKPGFSENFLTKFCTQNDQCEINPFWSVAVMFVIFYIPFFLYKKEIFSFLKRHLLWFRGHQTHENDRLPINADYTQHNDYNDAQERNELKKVICAAEGAGENNAEVQNAFQNTRRPNDVSVAFLKICFYFYQVESVLTMDRSDTKRGLLKKIHSFASSFFGFEFTVKDSSILCFKHSASPVEKMTTQLGLVAVVLAGFLLTYVVSLCIEKRFRGRGQGAKFSDRVFSTLFEVYLQCYAVFVRVILKLVTCIDVNGKSILYAQGDVECFTQWQYSLITVAVTWVIPFCLIVFLLPSLLSKGRIKERGLVVACFFPLLYMGFLAIQKIRQLINQEVNVDENDNTHQNHGMNSVLHNLVSAFHKDNNQTEYTWWEGVLILRRLVIIALASLIGDPYTKLYLILALQCLFLLHHVHVQPYNRRAMNALETATLTSLTFIGAMGFLNVPKDNKSSSHERLDQVFSWIQMLSTCALPIILGALLCVLAILQVVRGLCKCLCMIATRISRGTWT